jgi:putative colanic acid biosynthesis UDP-glucose lipid carrier transferase
MTMRASREHEIERWDSPGELPLPAHASAGASRASGQSKAATGEADSAAARSIAKRTFDLIVAVIAILFLAPLFLVVAAAIAIETGGPIFFRQRRTGYAGEAFMIFKFRTMTVAEDGASARQATADDKRVTRVGLLLRKLSIDELPQLLNVVRGEMSLIGPRPHAIGHDELFSRFVPNYAARFAAKPGLTGLAQVRGNRGEVREAQCIRDRVAADCEYIRTWSFWLDLQILARTVPLLFGDPNAY